MNYNPNWEDSKKRFVRWWNCEKTDRPLMNIISHHTPLDENAEIMTKNVSNEEKFFSNVAHMVDKAKFGWSHLDFNLDAFAQISVSLGPGSLAAYLGCDPTFEDTTIWYKHFVENWEELPPLKYNPDNIWWQRHLGYLKDAVRLANGEFYINIPDLVENIDILASMRGTQDLLFDLIDEPEEIKKRLKQLDDLYFDYYDRVYDIIKGDDGSSTFLGFNIWSPGRTAKLQCDFSAMISQGQFREFVLPGLAKQAKNLDYTLYHLDGVDAIRHLDAILEIKELNAVQWVPGAGQLQGGAEQWYPIYEKIRIAGKAMWIYIADGDIDQQIAETDKILKTFGAEGLYLNYNFMTSQEAEKLIDKANSSWMK